MAMKMAPGGSRSREAQVIEEAIPDLVRLLAECDILLARDELRSIIEREDDS